MGAVLECRRDGMNLAQIGQKLGISQAWAGKCLAAAMKEIIEEPTKDIVNIELARLDWYHQEAAKILKGWHPFVQGGGVVMHVVTDPDDCTIQRAVALEDVGPKLAAIKTLITLAARRAKLLGIDRPVNEKQENSPEEFAARIVAAVEIMNNVTTGGKPDPVVTAP